MSRLQEAQSIFRMGSGSMKPKHNFEPFYTATLYPGKTEFAAQRLLRTSKGLSGLQTTLRQHRRVRLGSRGLKRDPSFLWVKRHVKEGSGKEHVSQQMAQLGEPGGGRRTYLPGALKDRVSEKYVQEGSGNGHLCP